MRREPVRVGEEPANGRGERAARQVLLLEDDGGARALERARVLELVAVRRGRERHEDAPGRPAAASSASVIAPARQTTRSHHAIGFAELGDETARAASRPAGVRTPCRTVVEPFSPV